MEESSVRRIMFALDLLCPGLGHLAAGRFASGLAGLIVFAGAACGLVYVSILPLWTLLQALLNDETTAPEVRVHIGAVVFFLAVSLLDWMALLLDAVFRRAPKKD